MPYIDGRWTAETPGPATWEEAKADFLGVANEIQHSEIDDDMLVYRLDLAESVERLVTLIPQDGKDLSPADNKIRDAAVVTATFEAFFGNDEIAGREIITMEVTSFERQTGVQPSWLLDYFKTNLMEIAQRSKNAIAESEISSLRTFMELYDLLANGRWEKLGREFAPGSLWQKIVAGSIKDLGDSTQQSERLTV